jgi:hypothetical protein
MSGPPKQKYMKMSEFKEAGYLQEVNRTFFHPLGLALAVKVSKDGIVTLKGVQDHRDNPDGVTYAPMDADGAVAKATFINGERNKRATQRALAWGTHEQPAEEL